MRGHVHPIKYGINLPGLMLAVWALAAEAAPVDVAQLPPAVERKVDFAQDIRPILETSCLRCHGPEKPKSGYRLDNREAALKGGDEGVAIIPGDSAQSPLIHYVAFLVEDMEMPPPDKGEKLTPEQIGLLRAWIDQGAEWSAGVAPNQSLFQAALTLRGTGVDGDERKFREHHGRPEGIDGGAEQVEWFEQINANTRAHVTGRATRDDYAAGVEIRRNERGFVRAGWEQYRKYYDDTGGYRPVATAPAAISSGRDLYLDIGKAWIDLGLTLPDWPRMVLGYEYDYKRGEKNTTAWGTAGLGADARNIAPTTKRINEHTHVIKFDLDAEVKGVIIEERFRGEFYENRTRYTNAAARGPVRQDVRQQDSYFQGANSIRLEKQLRGWWLGSAGYFYSHLSAEASFQNNTMLQNNSYLALVPEITLERESHLFNLNSLFGPFAGLTISAGVQSEWTSEHGFGSGSLNRIPYTFVAPANLNTNAATIFSDHDENNVSETLALRYTKIPFTVLFAEGRLQQQCIDRSDADLQPSGSYLDNIDFTSFKSDARVGFDTSPWKAVSLSAHYRRRAEDSRYHNDQLPQPANTYPGFIRGREVETDEIEARLVLRPARWVKTTLSYQQRTTDSRVDTRAAINPAPPIVYSPGGELLGGQFDSDTYSLGTTFIPWQRLYLDTTISYQASQSVTADNGAATVAPYRGDVYTVLASGTYVLSKTVDLFGGYSFSTADYRQEHMVLGVPVGIEYQQHAAQIGITRRFGKVSTQLRYAYYRYEEPSVGGANDYDAHSIFGTVSFRLP